MRYTEWHFRLWNCNWVSPYRDSPQCCLFGHTHWTPAGQFWISSSQQLCEDLMITTLSNISHKTWVKVVASSSEFQSLILQSEYLSHSSHYRGYHLRYLYKDWSPNIHIYIYISPNICIYIYRYTYIYIYVYTCVYMCVSNNIICNVWFKKLNRSDTFIT